MGSNPWRIQAQISLEQSVPNSSSPFLPGRKLTYARPDIPVAMHGERPCVRVRPAQKGLPCSAEKGIVAG